MIYFYIFYLRRKLVIKNQYKIVGDTVIIYLKKRNGEILEGLIDLEDFEKVNKLNVTYFAAWDEDIQSYYIRYTKYLGMINGQFKNTTKLLHRIIMDAEKNDYVDHKTHNTLDNRKNNLKKTSCKNNTQNRLGANKNTSTGVRNVSWAKSLNRYLVQFQVDGKNTCFGRFKEEDFNKAVELAEKLRNEIYKGNIYNNEDEKII